MNTSSHKLSFYDHHCYCSFVNMIAIFVVVAAVVTTTTTTTSMVMVIIIIISDFLLNSASFICLLQWLLGFITFLLPVVSVGVKRFYMSYHRFWGAALLGLAGATVVMGITENVVFKV